MVPGSAQTAVEFIISWFDELVADALELDDRSYFPLIMGLFFFLWLCNVIGVIGLLPIPYVREPTRDINTPLALALIGFVVAHYAAIKRRGWKNYLKGIYDTKEQGNTPFFNLPQK